MATNPVSHADQYESFLERLDLLVDTDPIELRDQTFRLAAALRNIAFCPNPDSVENCHDRMSDIAKEALGWQ